jgi:hypothetical protein
MNKAVTEGLVLMPPPFAQGLNVWSSGNGTAGSPTYAGAANAALVPADPDFTGCLELQKTQSLQRLRWMGQMPVLTGCYLRVRARVKVMSGNIPTFRIAGYPAHPGGAQVGGVATQGPAVTPTNYGEVVEVSAIIGTGTRGGVNLNWAGVAYGHVGLDLTGPDGGVVRIDDLIIEDVTSFWLRDMMDWVDVRDFGAQGNGVANDQNAFVAANAAAAASGRSLLVSAGVYNIPDHLTITVPVRFEGHLVMPLAARLQLIRSYDYPTYARAFNNDELGFIKGVQALFHYTDHVSFDLRGRRVPVSAPLNLAALAAASSFNDRRQITNGRLDVQAGPAWNDVVMSAQASYSTSNPTELTSVANIANVPVGARVSGTGVGREVYVKSKNTGAGTLTLSQPLFGAAGVQTYTFTKMQHLLDFSGFATTDRFELHQLDLILRGEANGINLPTEGAIFTVKHCTFNRPRTKAITSTGRGCQGLIVDNSQFLSNEMALPAQQRTSVAINTNANDIKIRNNRVVRFGSFLVIGGTGSILMGNHFFQGDGSQNAVRTPGIVFTRPNLLTTVTGNYIDNCFLEFTNEHSATPAWNNQFSFGGITLTGNFFLCSNVVASFRFVVVKPFGPGHFLSGLQVSGNVFRTINGTINRVEGVDTTHADLARGSFRNVVWENNAYHGINTPAESPLVLRHDQSTAANVWTVQTAGQLPFNGWARTVTSLVMEGAPLGGGTEVRTAMPWVAVQQGPQSDSITLNWPSVTRGRAVVTIRCDNPV